MTLGARFGAIKCPYLSAIVQDSDEEAVRKAIQKTIIGGEATVWGTQQYFFAIKITS
jgi:hypothetical protein